MRLWRAAFGTDYVVPGGMYRGEPPPCYYHKEWAIMGAAGWGWHAIHATVHVTMRLAPAVMQRNHLSSGLWHGERVG